MKDGGVGKKWELSHDEFQSVALGVFGWLGLVGVALKRRAGGARATALGKGRGVGGGGGGGGRGGEEGQKKVRFVYFSVYSGIRTLVSRTGRGRAVVCAAVLQGYRVALGIRESSRTGLQPFHVLGQETEVDDVVKLACWSGI